MMILIMILILITIPAAAREETVTVSCGSSLTFNIMRSGFISGGSSATRKQNKSQNKSIVHYVSYVFKELYEEYKYVSETCWDKK